MANPRSRTPSIVWIAGGCLALLTCAVIAGAVLSLLVLGNRAPQAGPPNVEYVLDASPRMLQETDGASRLSVAEGVLAEIVRPASASVAAGLRVFGTGQVSGACQDTDLLLPLAAANQGKISDQLSTLQGGAGVDSALGVAMVSAIRDLAARRGTRSLVVVTGGADSCNTQADQLVAQEARRQGVDLQVFVVGFQVSDGDSVALQGVVDQTSGAQYIRAHNADDLRRSLAAIQAFVDKPGGLTVASVVATAGSQPVASAVPNVTLAVATPTALNTGGVQLSVLTFAGQPAETGGQLTVRAFSPQDHANQLDVNQSNPAQLRLPAGTYDLLVSYDAAVNASPYIGGMVEQWLTGVSVSSGLTTTQSYDMRLGRVSLTVLEAADKPVPDGNYAFAFRVYHAEDLDNAVATVILTSTAELQLTPGSYVVKVDYPLTALIGLPQTDHTFMVAAGQATAYTVNLNLGHLAVTVDDDRGQPLDPQRVTGEAYGPADGNLPFASSYALNPTDLALQAGVPYRVVLKLDNNQQLTLTNQQLSPGQVQSVHVALRDFK
jgi:hypothetical protein